MYVLEKVANAALGLCGAHFAEFAVGAFDRLPPPLFCRVVGGRPTWCASDRVSDHVASFCRAHPNKVNGALLAALTPADLMPTVSKASVLPLMQLR